MVLIMRQESADSVSCIAIDGENVVIGTTCGSVKLVTRFSSEKFNFVTLTKRSPEAIVGISIEGDVAHAVVGDVSVKRWNLARLSYDTPLVRGCRHDDIPLVMQHSVGHCYSSVTLIAERVGSERGPQAAIVRQSGQCCCIDLSTCQQRILDNVGPLLESDAEMLACCYHGDRLLWRYRNSKGQITFKIWDVSPDNAREIPVKFSWRLRSEVTGIRFLNYEAILMLSGGEFFLWSFAIEDFAHVTSKFIYIVAFEVLRVNVQTFVLMMTRNGRIELAELRNFQGDKPDPELKVIHPSRPQLSRAKLFSGTPYFVKAKLKEEKVTVLYNDDVGVHLEEDLFSIVT